MLISPIICFRGAVSRFPLISALSGVCFRSGLFLVFSPRKDRIGKHPSLLAWPFIVNEEQFRLHAEIEDRHWWFVARRQILRRLVEQLVPPLPEAKLIDVGCGTGGNIGGFADAYDCLGVDTSSDAIQLAAQRFPSVRFLQGFAPGDIFDAMGEADLVMLNDVLEHVEDDFGLLGNLIASMRPGAYLLLTVPADRQLWSEHDVSFGHFRRYTQTRLQRVWSELNVDVRLVSHFNTRLYLPVRAIRTWTRLRGKALGAAGTDFAIPPAPLNRLLTRLFAGESGRLSDILKGRPRRGYRRGVSLIAVLQCQAKATASPAATRDMGVLESEPTAEFDIAHQGR